MSEQYKERINKKLTLLLAQETQTPAYLREAMQYTVLSNGKRLRPQLVYSTGIDLGAPLHSLDHAAIAIELIHCYSLVHDDLPAMDDDDLRRGKATCHKAFDEATAILVGDALQSLAFETLATATSTNHTIQLQMIKTLAQASGRSGMVGGQLLDMQSQQKTISYNQLKQIHLNKTAALIAASIQLGALAAGHDDPTLLLQLHQLGDAIGLAFQIQDDLLDIESTTQSLGKTTQADLALQKATYPSIIGISASHSELDDNINNAISILKTTSHPLPSLLEIVKKIASRKH